MQDKFLHQLEQAATEEQQAALIALMALESQPETIRRAAIAAAVPHWFDGPVLAALLDDEPAETEELAQIYNTLQTLPFIQRYGDTGHALHDLTRAGLIGHLLQNQPEEFRAYSRRAADFFEQEADALEAAYHLLSRDIDAGLRRFYALMPALCERERDLNGAHRLTLYLRELLDLNAISGSRAERALSYGYSLLGNLQMNYASVSAAAQTYQQSLEIDERLAAADPANTEAQRDLSVSYNKLGDTQQQLGDTSAALRAYQKGLEIAEQLASADPANTQAQRDLSVSYERLGDTQQQLGDTSAALRAYQQSSEIFERLAAADPANTQARQDVAFSYERLGNVTLQQGDTQIAFDWYQKELEILTQLAENDPTNSAAQRALSVVYIKLGDTQQQLGDTSAALRAYQKDLEIAERLAAADPANTQAQRDLAVSYWRLGYFAETSEQPDDALRWYQQALPIAERLAQDSANAQAQNDLKWGQDVIKRLQSATKEEPEATLRLDVQATQATYRIGQMLTMTVKATQFCYLTIFNIDGAGAVTRIFPNAFATDNMLQGGETYRIPAETDSFDFQVTGPAGIENLHAVCLAENTRILADKFSDEAFSRFNGTAEEFKAALDEQLASLPAASWADAAFEIKITPAQ